MSNFIGKSFFQSIDINMSNKRPLKSNFEAYDGWRKHPLLNVNLRKDYKYLLPGFKYGVGLFVIYYILDKTMNIDEKIFGKPYHPGGHGHGKHH